MLIDEVAAAIYHIYGPHDYLSENSPTIDASVAAAQRLQDEGFLREE